MKDITYSVNNIPIRLTGERWIHIVENHEDMAGYYYDVLEAINNPSYSRLKKPLYPQSVPQLFFTIQ